MDNNLDLVVSKKAIIQSLKSKIENYSNTILSDIDRVKEIEGYFKWLTNIHAPKLKEVNIQFLKTLLTLVTKRSDFDQFDILLINELVDQKLTVGSDEFLEEPTLDSFHSPQELDFIKENKSFLERVANPQNNPEISEDAYSFVKLLIAIHHYPIIKKLCDIAHENTLSTEIIEQCYHTNIENSFSLYDLTVEQAVLTHKHNLLLQTVEWMNQTCTSDSNREYDLQELESRSMVVKALQEVVTNIDILIDNPEFQNTHIPLSQQRKMIKRFFIALCFPLSKISFKNGNLTTYFTYPSIENTGGEQEITFQIVNPIKPFFAIKNNDQYVEVEYDGTINSSYYETSSSFDPDLLDTLLQLIIPIIVD